MIGPAGFGQAPSEPAECAEWEVVDDSRRPSIEELCAYFSVPLPVEPGHVMSKKNYERLVREQQK